jgi:hypothetical protein
LTNLKEGEISIDQIVADTGYSSGEALRYCQENSIDAYIPNIGSYKSTREGFIYDKENDRYICIQGNEVILLFGHQIEIKMYENHFYKDAWGKSLTGSSNQHKNKERRKI